MTIFDCVAVFSGGLDSTTLVYDLLQRGYHPHLLSFDYGQRHRKELDYAKATGWGLQLRHDIIDLTSITGLISNSALTSGYEAKTVTEMPPAELPRRLIDVPEGHYAENNMKQTVVPNRNMIMLSIAAGVAVNNGYKFVATGVHAGDHFVYPDCRPRFLQATAAAVDIGNEGFHKFYIGMKPDGVEGPIFAPYVTATKEDIAFRAFDLNVPLERTWSCYKGGEKHCGKCGTCVERLEAIAGAQQRYAEDEVQVTDHTEYEDSNYWRTVVKS